MSEVPGLPSAVAPIRSRLAYVLGNELIGGELSGPVQVTMESIAAHIWATRGPSFESKADLNLELGYPAGAIAFVYGDPTPANNGVYLKAGAIDAGSWTRIGDLPEADLALIQAEIAALWTAINLGFSVIDIWETAIAVEKFQALTDDYKIYVVLIDHTTDSIVNDLADGKIKLVFDFNEIVADALGYRDEAEGFAANAAASAATAAAVSGAGAYTQTGTGALIRSNEDKLQELYYSPHEYGLCGLGDDAQDKIAIERVMNAAGITGGTVIYRRGVTYLCHRITATISKPVHVIGYGATFKRPDGVIDDEFDSMMLFTCATEGAFSWAGGTIDANFANNDLIALPEHCHSVMVTTVGSGFHNQYTKFKDITLKDRGPFDHLSVHNNADAWTDYVEFDTIESDDAPVGAHRGDLFYYQRCPNVVVKNCNVWWCETEMTNPITVPHRAHFIDSTFRAFCDIGYGEYESTPFADIYIENCDIASLSLIGATLHVKDSTIRDISGNGLRGSVYSADNEWHIPSSGMDVITHGDTGLDILDRVFDFRRDKLRLQDGETQTTSQYAMPFPTVLSAYTGTLEINVIDCEFLGTTPDGTESLFGRCIQLNGGIGEVYGNKYSCQDVALNIGALATISADMRIGPNRNIDVGGSAIHLSTWQHASCLAKFYGEMAVEDGTPATQSGGSIPAYIQSSRVLLGSAAPVTALVGDTFRQSPPVLASGLDARMIAKATGSPPGWHAQGNHPEVTLTDAATIAVDFALSNNFVVTLAGNRALGAPTNVMPGQRGHIRIIQDGVGGRTLTYNANWKFDGADPTMPVAIGAFALLEYYAISATVIYAKLTGALA